MDQVQKFLGSRGAASFGGKSTAQWMTYLNSVVFAQHPPSSLPPEKVRQLEALAKTLDGLGEGGIKSVADMLSQQFKSEELTLGGHSELAEEVQLLGVEDKMLATRAELMAARKSRLLKRKLDKSR